MVSSLKVANLFLSWANKDGDLITNLKIQKLLYYAQAWHLVYFNRPLFREPIEAWDFGPVVDNVYQAFKTFGCNAIKYKNTRKESKVFTNNQLEFLRSCYETFIKFSANELVNMTHGEDPWREAFKKGRSADIDHKSMKDYYSKLLKVRKNGKA